MMSNLSAVGVQLAACDSVCKFDRCKEWTNISSL